MRKRFLLLGHHDAAGSPFNKRGAPFGWDAFLLLGCTTAVILINTRVLGATGQGEIAWIQLGVLLVTGISGFLAGGAVVYLQKEIPLRAMLMPGHIWLVLAAILGTLIGAASGFLPTEHIAAIALLGWLQGMIIFHSQLLLAHHQIKRTTSSNRPKAVRYFWPWP